MARTTSTALRIVCVAAAIGALAGCTRRMAQAATVTPAPCLLHRARAADRSGKISTALDSQRDPRQSGSGNRRQKVVAGRTSRRRPLQYATQPVPGRPLPRVTVRASARGPAGVAHGGLGMRPGPHGVLGVEPCRGRAPPPWLSKASTSSSSAPAPAAMSTAIRAASSGFKTAIVERDYLGGICLNWGCIPDQGAAALGRSLPLPAACQGLRSHRRERRFRRRGRGGAFAQGVAKRLNDGVGFLMKKNKIAVIWGEAAIEAPGKLYVVKASKSEAPKGALRPRHLPGQAHHRRHRRAAARTAGPGAGQEAGVDLLRGDGAASDAEVPAGRGLGCDRHRVRLASSARSARR